MASKRTPPSRGYDPYNTAGPKNPASSRGPKSVSEARLRAHRAGVEAGRTGKNVQSAMSNSSNAAKAMRHAPTVSEAVNRAKGMTRKNAAKAAELKARPSKIGWAKAGGAKRTGSAVKWGGISRTTGSAAGSLGKTMLGAFARVNAVASAGAAGYAAGSALNKKFNISTKIVDAVSPKYDPNPKKRKR
jgi:hypothetical protein